MELFAPLRARKQFVDPCGEARCVVHGLGRGCERAIHEFLVGNESGDLEQTRPHEAGSAKQVEERVLREQ